MWSLVHNFAYSMIARSENRKMNSGSVSDPLSVKLPSRIQCAKLRNRTDLPDGQAKGVAADREAADAFARSALLDDGAQATSRVSTDCSDTEAIRAIKDSRFAGAHWQPAARLPFGGEAG